MKNFAGLLVILLLIGFALPNLKESTIIRVAAVVAVLTAIGYYYFNLI